MFYSLHVDDKKLSKSIFPCADFYASFADKLMMCEALYALRMLRLLTWAGSVSCVVCTRFRVVPCAHEPNPATKPMSLCIM